MKKILLKVGRYTIRTLLGLLALIGGYLLAALLLGLIPVNRSFQPAESGIDLYVYSNGLHTDFVLPVRTPTYNWHSLISPDLFANSFRQAPYIGFGWGDRAFFRHTPTWSELEVPVAFQALFLPSPAAMHVTLYARPPAPGPRCRVLKLTPAQFGILKQYITQSFTYQDNQIIPIAGGGYTSSDHFFEATGSYHLFYTSNSWAAGGLRRTGVRSPVWAPFDSGIFFHLDKTE